MSFYMLTILTISSLAARSEWMLQWCLKYTELCLLFCGYFLTPNELKQSADLSYSIIFLSSIFLSIGKPLPILSTSLDSNGLLTNNLLTVGRLNSHIGKITGWLQRNRVNVTSVITGGARELRRTSQVVAWMCTARLPNTEEKLALTVNHSLATVTRE